MAPYEYQFLDATKNEIRILHLQPGRRDDLIRLSIEHVAFEPSKDNASPRISDERLQRLQADLPDDWCIFRTLEGQAIYFFPSEDERPYSSWKSPNSTHDDAHSTEKEVSSKKRVEPEFEAVSYTWGSSNPLAEIQIIDSQSPATHIGTLNIGPNLHEMLRYLRRLGTARRLWIDAICINQVDSMEKSQQIKRMRDIYTFAKRVVIWLGDYSRNSSLALRSLEYVGRQIEHTSDFYILPSPDRTERDWWDVTHPIPLSTKAWTAIAHLIQRPYWERLWIVQEIQTGNNHSIVQCGGFDASWYHVRRGFIRCSQTLAQLPQFSTPASIWQLRSVNHLSRNLKSAGVDWLFEVSTRHKCSDARDKVFAILGLLPPRLAQRIQPDYTSTVDCVYKQIFLATLDFTKRLYVLDAANPKESATGRPSWLLDFTPPSPEHHAVGPMGFASSQSAAHATYQSPNQLHVRGVLHGHVKAVSPTTTYDARFDYTAVRELVSLHLPHLTDEDCLESYLWTMTQGDLRDRCFIRAVVPWLEEAKAMIQDLWAGNDVAVNEAQKEWFLMNMTKQQPGKFFVTDNGLLGCGPVAAQANDVIYIPLGYDKPVLLRRTTSDPQLTSFELIGRVYIHDLMDAQALLGPLPSPWMMVIARIDSNISRHEFFNTQTTEQTSRDPRLGALPVEWEEVEMEDEVRVREALQHYRNTETGEVINSDPRLLPEALEARGVKVETFVLV
jgi:hypothetical protein